ncbi:MAG: plastocyanin/azurin family copper-binding protein [Nitriliruptorales bacterium]|nr:plastocyanin/azurin family copper-binding protein [Nitriliruptorales bacterium]
MKRWNTVGALVVAIAVLSGCTSDDQSSAQQSDPGSPMSVEISIENFEFMPDEIEVPVGSTITWTNQDDFAHTVTSGEPAQQTGRFDEELGSLGAHESSGKMASVTVDEPGAISYFCRFHPRMTATVVVTEES